MTLWQPGMLMTASRLQAAGPWVPLTSIGSYQGGASDGSVQPMARDVYIRDEVNREFKGIINLSGVTTAGYTFFGFTGAYIPDYERNWGAAGTSANTAFRIYLSTAGNWGMTGQPAGVATLRLDEFVIKSATGRIPT
ncbi:hypothetical protein TPA0906_34870 [Streptomyces olivaceus]|uniref:hypothetical protein n=1 Tax=Streptomyces olivaceus TaxID=47716 RepID=UPI0022EE8257|nr:hypothetical protein [Streptomyces olivaceus]GHJ01622.1 hypothetical protein TPA0906_34870 [Streptomyces olivaceus]